MIIPTGPAQLHPLPPSPLQAIPINHPGASRNIRLWMKRDDLVHPHIIGNKWRKMRLWLDAQFKTGLSGIVSFGGPFSNHLLAVATAGHIYGVKTAGIVRGLHFDPENPVLSEATALGMQLFPISKHNYNAVGNGDYSAISHILHQLPDYAVLPEGGSHPLGVQGCQDIALELLHQVDDPGRVIIAVPAGTGSTAAGIAAAWPFPERVWVFPAAPYGTDKPGLLSQTTIWNQYHEGRFARVSDQTAALARSFTQQTGIPLDPIYTTKLIGGVWDLLGKALVPENTDLVLLHTGGRMRELANVLIGELENVLMC